MSGLPVVAARTELNAATQKVRAGLPGKDTYPRVAAKTAQLMLLEADLLDALAQLRRIR